MKANEPAYPTIKTSSEGWPGSIGGPTNREKLAMEIYVGTILSNEMVKSFITETDNEVGNEVFLETAARSSLRAADIFFEVMEKK